MTIAMAGRSFRAVTNLGCRYFLSNDRSTYCMMPPLR
jgi:hypothetical protein